MTKLTKGVIKMKNVSFELQCSVEDIMYVADKELNCVVPIEIDSVNIKLDRLSDKPNIIYNGVFCDDDDNVTNAPEYEFTDNDINDWVFFTNKEAEKVLEMVLGLPAHFWSNLENIYREKLIM